MSKDERKALGKRYPMKDEGFFMTVLTWGFNIRANDALEEKYRAELEQESRQDKEAFFAKYNSLRRL